MTTNYTYLPDVKTRAVYIYDNGNSTLTLNAAVLDLAAKGLGKNFGKRIGDRIYAKIEEVSIELAPARDGGCWLSFLVVEDGVVCTLKFPAPELRWVYDMVLENGEEWRK